MPTEAGVAEKDNIPKALRGSLRAVSFYNSYWRIVRKSGSIDAEMKELAMDQEWFEMHDIRQRKFNTAVWIPLRASRSASSGESGKLGYKDEFFGAASIAVPVNQRAQAETLDWTSIGLSHSHCGYVEGDRYKPADVFEGYGRNLNAVALALDQDGNSDEFSEWHLHQDLAITLKLKREGDKWLAMNEAYIEVARLKRGRKGRTHTSRNPRRVFERLFVRARHGTFR